MEIKGKNTQEPSALAKGENPQEPLPSEQISPIHIDEKFLLSNWYQDIVNFLIHFECPTSFSKTQCKTLKLKSIKYYIINANLYWKVPLNILLLCLKESEIEGIIDQFHTGFCGGHYAWRETTYKILSEDFIGLHCSYKYEQRSEVLFLAKCLLANKN